jgi:hypothetical protein
LQIHVIFCSRSLEILEIGTLTTLKVHNFVCKHSIEMRFKVKLYPLLMISNDMQHATCMQINGAIPDF